MERSSSNGNQTTWRMGALFLLTLIAIVLSALVIRPFLPGIIFAITIAICTQKPYRWLASRIRNPSLCAAVALILLLFVGVAPIVAIGKQLFTQATSVIKAINSGAANTWFEHFITQHPTLAVRFQNLLDLFDFSAFTQTAASWSGQQLVRFIGSSATVLFQIVVMLFLLFFLWRDQQTAIRFLRSLLPLNDEDAAVLIQRLHDTIYATGFGRLTIAVVQGILGGLAYWALGVPGPGFWGFVTALFAIIPGFGAVLVWAPIALYLGLGDSWGKALLLTLWGGGFVSLIDNFLYPYLVGSRLQMHTATIFLSLLGGVALFGASGIILGPLVFTLATTLLETWRHHHQPTT